MATNDVAAADVAASFRRLAGAAYDNWGSTPDGSEEEARWQRMREAFNAEAARWERD